MIKNQWANWSHVILLALVGGFVIDRANAQSLNDAIEVEECIVRFANEVQVPALESGLVAAIKCKTNDNIKAGQPIARLDDRLLLKRRQVAGVRLDSATSEALNDAGLRYAETSLKEAEEELDRNRKIQSERAGAVMRDRIRQLRLSVERGQLEVEMAKQKLSRATAEAKIQQSEVAVLDDQLRNLHADSPIDGIVLQVNRSAGEWIEKGEPIATVAQIDRLHIHAFVSSKQIAPTQCPNLPVSVLWQDPSTGAKRILTGRVLSVDPQRMPDHRFRLHAEIINRTEPTNSSQWQLNPGADVRMIVHLGSTAKRTSQDSGKKR